MAIVALILVTGISTKALPDGIDIGAAGDGAAGGAAPNAARSLEVMEPKRPVPFPKRRLSRLVFQRLECSVTKVYIFFN